MSSHRLTVWSLLKRLFADLKKERKSIVAIFKRNYFHRYAGAKFNLLWVYIMPCSPIIIYNFLEKLGVFGSHESGIPRSVYVTFGLTMYFIFPESLNIIGSALSSNRNYILKTGLSKVSAILVSCLEVVSNFLIRLVFMSSILIIFTNNFSINFLYLPIYGFIMMLFSFSLGIFVSIFSILYKDLNSVTGMIGFYMLFASGIFLPIPQGNWFFEALQTSPIYKIIQEGRDVCLFSNGLTDSSIYYIAIGSFVFFVFAIVALYRVDPLLDQAI